MGVLAIRNILAIWEAAVELHPIDRALTILAAAFPHKTLSDLAALSIGRRDALLFEVYRTTFGAAIECLANCAHCNELLEFRLDLNAFTGEQIMTQAPAYELTVDEYELRFRLPNSFDLANIAMLSKSENGITAAYQQLISHCVLAAIAPETMDRTMEIELPDTVLAALAHEMTKHDPQAEIQLDLACPACGQHWMALLDIITFLWARIQSEAQRLLGDVDRLARAYGWREDDILAMSPLRRRYYLDVLL